MLHCAICRTHLCDVQSRYLEMHYTLFDRQAYYRAGQHGAGIEHKMIRIVYVSTAAMDLGEADLGALLALAQARNQKQRITGLLVYNGRNFMQALEGKADDVADVMTSISQDKRHTGVIVISKQTIPHRSFPDWSMHLTRAQCAARPDMLLNGNGLPEEVLATADPEIARLFHNFNALA